MAVVLSFAAMIGVPFFAAVVIDALRMRRLFRVILIVSVPVITFALLFLPEYSLADVGVPIILMFVAGAWLVGFLVAPFLHNLWNFAKPS